MEELYKMFEFSKSNSVVGYYNISGTDEVIILKREDGEITEYDEVSSFQSLFDVLETMIDLFNDDYQIDYFEKTTFEELTKEVNEMDETQYQIYTRIKNYFYTDEDLIKAYEENIELKEKLNALSKEIEELKTKINNL